MKRTRDKVMFILKNRKGEVMEFTKGSTLRKLLSLLPLSHKRPTVP